MNKPDKLDEILVDYSMYIAQVAFTTSEAYKDNPEAIPAKPLINAGIQKRLEAKAEIEKHYRDKVKEAIGEDENTDPATGMNTPEGIIPAYVINMGKNQLRAELRERLGLDK